MSIPDQTLPGATRRIALVIGGSLVGAALWLGLTGGDATSLFVGVPTVLVAVAVADRARAARFLPRLAALPGFLAFFLWQQMLAAGFIAARVMRRRITLEPGVVETRLQLRGDGARAVYMSALTLMPGTLAAALDGDRLSVHAIDRTADIAADLDRLQHRVARLFGQSLAGGAAAESP